jgi:hypothetical protein
MRIGQINQSTSGLLNSGGWQLIEDKLFSTAATSHTFSGLDGDTDQEYRLVSRIVNGHTPESIGVYLRPNNDTGTNYGWQYLCGKSTIASANRYTTEVGLLLFLYGITALNSSSLSDTILYAQSGSVRTAITKVAEDISGTTVSDVLSLGTSWNNTLDNITSLTVTASQTDGLGVGTHLFLFKKNLLGTEASSGIRTGDLNIQGAINTGEFQKIYQNTLATAATSVTISGLDGDTDVLYELRMRLVNGYNGASTQGISINTDTANNYGYQYLYAISTTTTSVRNTSAAGLFLFGAAGALNEKSLSKILLYAKSGYIRAGINELTSGIATTTINMALLSGVDWNNTADNITSLTVVSAQSLGLGIGTVIELWALRKKL